VVAELGVLAVVAVVVREAAVPNSPRWWCWSPIAAVAVVTSRSAELRDVGRAELHEVARQAGADARGSRGGRARGRWTRRHPGGYPREPSPWLGRAPIAVAVLVAEFAALDVGHVAYEHERLRVRWSPSGSRWWSTTRGGRCPSTTRGGERLAVAAVAELYAVAVELRSGPRGRRARGRRAARGGGRRRCPARGGRRRGAVVADLVVAELVVAALHEVARQAGADARLEVVGSRWR
jgi:hypothetical protein